MKLRLFFVNLCELLGRLISGNRPAFINVKLYLITCRITVVIAKCIGCHF